MDLIDIKIPNFPVFVEWLKVQSKAKRKFLQCDPLTCPVSQFLVETISPEVKRVEVGTDDVELFRKSRDTLGVTHKLGRRYRKFIREFDCLGKVVENPSPVSARRAHSVAVTL